MFNQQWRYIKILDAFKSPIFLFLHRRNKTTNLKTNHRIMGSAIGGVMTIIMVMAIAAVFISYCFSMIDGQLDIVS
jgi:hypothetical protein